MPFKNQLMKNNYHTHMYLCRHATGDVEDYVIEAIKLGFQTLGMSDHAPFVELKDRSIRMRPKDLPIYLEKCDNAILKYQDQIQIIKGLEIEYFSEHHEMYDSLLTKVDYLALGQHYIKDNLSPNGLRSSYGLFTTDQIRNYVETVITAMDSGYFKFVCHPDLMLYNMFHFDKDLEILSRALIESAVKNDVPLEINSNGIRKGLRDTEDGPRYLYPRLEFWKLVKELKAKVIISSDAHVPNQLFDEDVIKAYEFAKTLDLVVEEELKF